MKFAEFELYEAVYRVRENSNGLPADPLTNAQRELVYRAIQQELGLIASSASTNAVGLGWTTESGRTMSGQSEYRRCTAAGVSGQTAGLVLATRQ